MKQTGALLCLVIGFAAVKGISISGRATFNRSGISAGASFIFPRIPGINVPLSSLFDSRTTTPSSTSNTSTKSPSGNSTSTNNTNNDNPSSNSTSSDSSSSNSTNSDSPSNNNTSSPGSLLGLFNVPSAISLIPGLSSNGIPSIPRIPGLSNLAGSSAIPGVDKALDEARQHVTEALSLGANFEIGISQAIDDALASDDPTAALRTLAQTILDAYATVAANCPLIVIGSRVLQEGIRLAMEVARSAENIIFGTTTNSTTVAQ